MTASEIRAASLRTERAALDLAAASKIAAARRDPEFFQSADRAALVAKTVETIGRVTIAASVGGNSRRPHCRHTFKIDGRRASRAQVAALIA